MNAVDLIIIYLACGSPFGVYRATSQWPIDWLNVLLGFLFWPAFAALLIADRLFSKKARARAEFQLRLEDIRLALENTAFSGESIAGLFDFRETFYRYVGLSDAAITTDQSVSNAEIFDVTGHPNNPLASACLARRNSARLSAHRAAASEEFVRSISRLAATTASSIQIRNLALALADHLGDGETASLIREAGVAAIKPDGEWTSGLEKEIWNSRTHSTYTIN